MLQLWILNYILNELAFKEFFGFFTKPKNITSSLKDSSLFCCRLSSHLETVFEMKVFQHLNTFAISHHSSPHPFTPRNPPLLLCSFSPPNLHPPTFSFLFHLSSLFVSKILARAPAPIICSLIQSHSSLHVASPAHKASSLSSILWFYFLFTETVQHKSIIFS